MENLYNEADPYMMLHETVPVVCYALFGFSSICVMLLAGTMCYCYTRFNMRAVTSITETEPEPRPCASYYTQDIKRAPVTDIPPPLPPDNRYSRHLKGRTCSSDSGTESDTYLVPSPTEDTYMIPSGGETAYIDMTANIRKKFEVQDIREEDDDDEEAIYVEEMLYIKPLP